MATSSFRSSLFLLLCVVCVLHAQSQVSQKHNLKFDSFPSVWDEGIPLGNAVLGALVWKKDDKLRFSLDRADLWDLRPMKGLHGPHFSYKWIQQQVAKKEYDIVQEKLDQPYEHEAAPSKIPGAALEIDIAAFGEVEYVQLDLASAVCEIKWKNGVVLQSFVHATLPVGWIRLVNIHEAFLSKLIPPAYQSLAKSGSGSVDGDDLNRLAYEQGTVREIDNGVVYTQKGWGDFSYEVATTFRRTDSLVELAWSISSNDVHSRRKPGKSATDNVNAALKRSLIVDLDTHTKWWKNYWSKSYIAVPDSVLEKQWYLEQYKFGSAARKDAPPITLQAIWTADNGRLPPWKGDLHHDLNTQLSYWPSYSANHLEEGSGYYRHLDANKANYKRYTREFFGVEGLNVPGVTTLDGTEMGGWIQYSGSPTISAWLAHNYYLQWRYSMDEQFLKKSAYPWIKETATFIENITSKTDSGYRKLPLSSSPEIYNNSINAWFTSNTNYDLALMKFVAGAATKTATTLGYTADVARWKKLANELSDYALSDSSELLFAAGKPYNESHRHFSNLMAIHPLSLITWEGGEDERKIITRSIKLLDSIGPDWWCGYSYSWLANLKARMKDGDGARKALEIFTNAFCLPNSFHANGDQTKSGYSKFVYRPFTLEGNFAFAAGLQEMLMQSYAGFIELFPAVPSEWKNVSFGTLRADGAILVDARRRGGELDYVKLTAERGGNVKIKIEPGSFSSQQLSHARVIGSKDGLLEISFAKGGTASWQR